MLAKTLLTPAELQESAQRIKTLRRAATEHAVEIGRELLRVKENLPHGAFVKWVERACEFKIRTAQDLMKLASEAERDKQLVALMVPSTLRVYLAKTTPQTVRNTILKRLENGGRVSRNELYFEAQHERSKAKEKSDGESEQKQSPSSFSGPDLLRAEERRSGAGGNRSRMVAELIVRRLSRKDYEAIMTDMNWGIWNQTLVWLRTARIVDAERVELAPPGAPVTRALEAAAAKQR
ncbi:MAG: DUF3102 domain-containing protein [Pseudolabrys sp.]